MGQTNKETIETLKDKRKQKLLSKKEKEKQKYLLIREKAFLQRANEDNKLFTAESHKKYKFSRVGTAQLYEKIGEAEVWQGVRPVLKNDDEELGSYIVLQISAIKYVFLDNVTPEDWTPTNAGKNIGKLLEVVKYSEDDFRVRAKVKGKSFYTKKPIYKKELVTQTINNPETGEEEEIQLYEPVYDDDGNPEVEYYEEVVWEEPKAVSQTGREAIRIGNAYKLRMQRKRALKESFLSKHAMHIIFLVFTVLVCGTYYVTTKMQVSAMGEEWGELREERGSGILDPEVLAKAVVKEQKETEAHEGAPPS